MAYDCSPVKRRKISHASHEDHFESNENLILLSSVAARITEALVNQNDAFLLSSGDDGDSHSRKKLIVLDVNGLLVDIVADPDEAHKPDTTIAAKAVFKRPFCDDFLKFCFERFSVGVWTSRTRKNISRVLDFLMRDTQHQLLFCWDQSHCTETGFNTIENTGKPLLLKELKKLWEKQDPNLPWDRGAYDESNTLLLDDSPYKALRNPPYTAIFPYTYSYRNTQDNSLGPNGDLRNYLERLAASDNVQKFIEQNPFGQQPITHDNESWNFYHKIICSTQPGAGPSRSRKKLIVIDMAGLLFDVTSAPREGFRADIVHGSRAVFKRPYWDEFLQFCFQRFNVGVWTSTRRRNMERSLDFLMRGTQHKFLFYWDLAHCTDTGFYTVENSGKKIILKELRKLWEKKDPNLPWEVGEYDESNTLLVDSVSDRALLNPPHTAIFPYPYHYWNREDNSLGPKGDLRMYLERLAASENVQKFVSENSFGQRPIREKNVSWGYYQRVIRALSYKRISGYSVDAQCKNPSEPKSDTSIASVTKTLAEQKTDSSTAFVAQPLLEPKPNTTTISATEANTITTLVGQTLLEPDVDTTAAGQTSLEPETITTTILTAPAFLEPGIGTTTVLVGQPPSEPDRDSTARAAQISLESETVTTTVLTAPALLEPGIGTPAVVGQSLPEPEINTTSSKGALTSDMDNVTVGTALSAKNKSPSPKRSESNSAANNSVENLCVNWFQSSTGGKGNTKATASVVGTSGSDDILQDSPRVEPQVIMKKTSEADDSTSSLKRKRGKPPKLAVQKPVGSLDPDPAIVTTDYQQDWPFMKLCPIWATIEPLVLKPPQKPHFSPLKKTQELYREGLAIAHMVTYWNLVQRLSSLTPNDPIDIIHNTLEILVDLETHGFDVDAIRGRLNELLYLKSKAGRHEDILKELEQNKAELLVMQEKIDRLKATMEKLQVKRAPAKAM